MESDSVGLHLARSKYLVVGKVDSMAWQPPASSLSQQRELTLFLNDKNNQPIEKGQSVEALEMRLKPPSQRGLVF